MSSQPLLHLYDHPVSSYAQKIRLALRFKNIPFTKEIPRNLGTGQPNATFSAINPRMEVPALIVENGQHTIFDSTIILQFIDEAFPSLLPQDPIRRAEARMIEEICDTHYEAINWSVAEIKHFGRATSSAEETRLLAVAKEQIYQIHDWLETKLHDSQPYFNGADFGYADICVAPFVNRSAIDGNGPEPGTKLEAWYERVKDITCVQETFQELEEALPKMAALGPQAWKKGNGMRREYRDHRLEFWVKNGGIGTILKGIEDGNMRFGWPEP